MCILLFKNWKINTLSSKSMQTEKAKSSHFDRRRGDKTQIFPTLSLPWKLDNIYYHNQDVCQRQLDQLAKALKTCYETTPSPPLKEFVKRGKINSFVNGILFQKLFWPTVRKNCLSEREKLLKFETEGWEFAKILRSLK